MLNIYGKKILYDLDGVLCTNTWDDGEPYVSAEPDWEEIIICNMLYDNGNYIHINTGRGTVTGIDWREITEKQLQEWGIKYHKLTVGKKPTYDYIVDDKMLDTNILKKNDKAIIIEKIWGHEEILEKNESYMIKKMYIEEGKNTSLHYHCIKRETFLVEHGIGRVAIENKIIDIKKGDIIHLDPYTRHQTLAGTNLVIIETSTPENEDVIRIREDAVC